MRRRCCSPGTEVLYSTPCARAKPCTPHGGQTRGDFWGPSGSARRPPGASWGSLPPASSSGDFMGGRERSSVVPCTLCPCSREAGALERGSGAQLPCPMGHLGPEPRRELPWLKALLFVCARLPGLVLTLRIFMGPLL